MHALDHCLRDENRLSEEKKIIRLQQQRGLANRKSTGRTRRLDQDFSAQIVQISKQQMNIYAIYNFAKSSVCFWTTGLN